MAAPAEKITADALKGVGTSRKRKEDPRFIQGRGHYVDDIKLPGMLFADVVRSPFAHARIKSIDISAAEALEGVHAVVTGADLPGKPGPGPALVRIIVFKTDSRCADAAAKIGLHWAVELRLPPCVDHERVR